MKRIQCLFCILTVCVQLGNSIPGFCSLLNSQAKCLVNVGQIPIQVSVLVNQCHQPVDVTFMLKVQNPEVDWKRTFVITNSVESQEVPGLPERVTLHVTASNMKPQQVLLTADFHTDMENSVTFMNTTIQLKELRSCRNLGSTYISHVVAGVMMPLLLLVLATGSFLLYCKCRKHTMDRLTLVENMAGIPGASPYQEGSPIVSFHKDDEAANELVIENSFATRRNESTA